MTDMKTVWKLVEVALLFVAAVEGLVGNDAGAAYAVALAVYIHVAVRA